MTLDLRNQSIGFQGEVAEVQITNFFFFQFSIIFLAVSGAVLLGFSLFMVWFLRVGRQGKSSRLTEISLSTRFLDTS